MLTRALRALLELVAVAAFMAAVLSLTIIAAAVSAPGV